MMMQELNRTISGVGTMSVDQESCKHEIVYFGVTNINYEKRTIGSVDIWRCVKCKKIFCEEKQLGIENIVDYVGMPKINPDQKMIVNIGAGASVEQDRDSAINYMESRIKELEVVLQQLSNQRQEISMRLEQGQHEMNRLIQSSRGSVQ